MKRASGDSTSHSAVHHPTLQREHVQKSPSHLYLKGNIWYFRYALPPKLRARFACSEIRLSLSTPYLSDSRKYATALTSCLEDMCILRRSVATGAVHSGHDAPASGRLCDGEWPVAVALWNGAAVRLDQSFLTEGRNFSFPATQTHQECHARRHPAQGNASQRQRGLARLFRVPRWRHLALGSSRGKRQVRCVARRKEKFGMEGGGHPFSPPGRRLLSLIEGWPLYSALVSTG